MKCLEAFAKLIKKQAELEEALKNGSSKLPDNNS